MAKADIGLIGLAVMGQNLVLNMNDHGFTVAVFNRTVSKVDEFLAGGAKGTRIRGAHSLPELVGMLKRPRRVMLLVQAGPAVDDFIEQLIPLLEKGDIIIDGGNSNYNDTIRRTAFVESKGSSTSAPASRAARRGRGSAPRSCPADRPRRGGTSSRSSRRSRPRWTARPAATGSAKTARGTTSRWCTTASSTATCSSSARRTS